MAFTLEQIESLHNAGLMSDWAYYQQNGKSLQENFIEIERKFHEKLRMRAQMEAEIQRRVNAALAQQESEEYTVNIKTNVRVKK